MYSFTKVIEFNMIHLFMRICLTKCRLYLKMKLLSLVTCPLAERTTVHVQARQCTKICSRFAHARTRRFL